MKKTNTLLSLSTLALTLTLALGFSPAPSGCDQIIFFKEGTVTTMTSYNDDGKVTGSTRTTYTGVTKTPAGASVKATQEHFDKKGKPSTKNEFSIRCEKGVLNFDMRAMLSQQQTEQYKDFEMTMEGNNMEFPAVLTVGSTLKDADVKITMKTKDGMTMPMMNISMKVTNRKVEAKESITTPAGTFECYKISQDMEMRTMFAMKMRSVEWFSFEAGAIRTESYKDNGKFMGKTELTELKK